MKYQIISHQHLFEPERYFPQCHASTLVFLPHGGLGAAWFGGTCEQADDVGIWFSRRIAQDWSAPVKVAQGNGAPCWNPVLLAEGDRLLLFYKVGKKIPQWQTMVMESADSGLTWSPAREAVKGDFGGRGPVKNKCIRLKSGALLAPASTETAAEWNCFVDRSEDGGQTWSRGENVPLCRESLLGLGAIQPTLWEDDGGTVHMLMRSTEGAVLQSSSQDGGRTWSMARRTALPNNNSGLDLVKMESGRLVLVYNPVSGNWAARSPIAFSVSEDNGKTWSAPQVLDQAAGGEMGREAEFSYPAVIARGEDVYITYTWKRRTIAYWQIRFSPPAVPKNKRTGGVWVTMVTPFTPAGAVDYPALEALVEWYIAKGVDGLFAVCQSSEMFFLSEEERVAIARFVVEKADGRVPVVVSGHVSGEMAAQIRELSRMAETGAQAVVLVTNRLAQQGEDESVWKANAVKLMEALPGCTFGLYECPYPYKRLLSPELLRWCAETGRFAFLKDTCCDIAQIRARLAAVAHTDLKLFNANSATLLDSLRAGANGFCGVMANFHPELYVWLCKNWEEDPPRAELLADFATVASLAELQMYPVNAKYHLRRCGVPMELMSRSKDPKDWNALRQKEMDALLQSWRGLARLLAL